MSAEVLECDDFAIHAEENDSLIEKLRGYRAPVEIGGPSYRMPVLPQLVIHRPTPLLASRP